MMSQVRALYPQFGTLAQLVEHLVEAQVVAGSSPAGSIKFSTIGATECSSPCHGEGHGFEPRMVRYHRRITAREDVLESLLL